jgi:hypothetical protein
MARKKANAISKQILDNLNLHTELEEKIAYPNLKEQDEKIFSCLVDIHS